MVKKTKHGSFTERQKGQYLSDGFSKNWSKSRMRVEVQISDGQKLSTLGKAKWRGICGHEVRLITRTHKKLSQVVWRDSS